MATKQLEQIREIALALPGVSERLSAGAPCFYVRKKAICRFHDANYGRDDRVLFSSSMVEVDRGG